MNKDFNSNYNPYKEEGNSLIFKDHKDFFERFHELREKITEGVGIALFNLDYTKECLGFMFGLIQWTSIYIQKMDKLEDIDAQFQKALNLFKGGKKLESINTLNILYRDLNEIYEFNELIPQVKVVDKDTEDIEVLTKHALAAYKLINSVK